MIICITGMPGSGKTMAADRLKKRGFGIMEMGNIVRDMMNEKHIPINNTSLREFALKIRKQHGRIAVAREVVKNIRKRHGDVGIVGVRSVYEIKYFRENLDDIVVIAVEAPKPMRFMRLKARGRADDPKNQGDFEYREKKEKRYGVEGAIKQADYVVPNNGTLKKLATEIDAVLDRAGA